MTVASMCLRLRSELNEAIDRLLAGRHWKLRAVLSVVALSLLRAFPSYEALHSSFVETTWRIAVAKIDNPRIDESRMFPPESHESKLAFRLTVPVIAHALRLRQRGVLLASGLSGLMLLYSSLSVSYAITANKRAAIFVCLSVACAWPGAAAYHELRGGYYDAVALCLLLLGLSTSSSILTALWVFLAAWTDERALIASPLLLLFWAGADLPARLRLRKTAAIAAACGGYLGARAYLTATHRFAATTTRGMGLPLFSRQINIAPLGIWTGLGGAWIIVVSGLIALLLQKRFLMAGAYCIALALVTGAALSVADVTRSMAYCIPAVFLGLRFLSHEPAGDVETIAALSGLLSFAVPTHYVEGGNGVWWLYPLPVQAFRWLL